MKASPSDSRVWRGPKTTESKLLCRSGSLVASVVGGRDLAMLVGGLPPDLPVPSAVLGIWTALVADIVGLAEIRESRRGGNDSRAFAAAALLVAVGIALLLTALRTAAKPAPVLRVLWPVALLAGAFAHRPPPITDPLAEARQEMQIVLSGLERTGARVLPVEAPAGAHRLAPAPVRMFRIEGNDVQVYLIAHNDDSGPEAHLSPRVDVPPPIRGVPHLHVGPHILVLCVTADPFFARQLDRLVHGLAGHRRLAAFASMVSASR